jgi:hypothetical protein
LPPALKQLLQNLQANVPAGLGRLHDKCSRRRSCSCHSEGNEESPIIEILRFALDDNPEAIFCSKIESDWC